MSGQSSILSDRALPASIGRYQPLSLLGSGAMGSVYRAHDPVIDRVVAIKVVRTEGLEPDVHEEFLDRFRREVQAAGRCNHSSIVNVFDFATDNGNPFIVMEYVAGRTLSSVFRDPAARAALRVMPILGQVLDGLGYAHALGITHRDIKPANILMTEAGFAKIADFGIARLSGSSVTMAGTMLGTPSYMAPEQVSDDRVDHRADLFAVGIILYEALIGKPPFVGKSLTDTILRVSGPAPADLTPLQGTANAAFIPLLQRALAKPREQRFQSAGEFAGALRTLSGNATPPQPSAPDATIVVAPSTHAATQRATQYEHWDASLVSRLERALARYLGPMAKVATRKAAARAGDADQLVDMLARDIPDAVDRAAFIREAGARPEPTLVRTPSDVPITEVVTPLLAATQQNTGGIPQFAIDAAQAILVVFVGPMARVLVRKAAAQANSGHDFIERLCGSISKPDEVATLRRRLQAEIEPRLR